MFHELNHKNIADLTVLIRNSIILELFRIDQKTRKLRDRNQLQDWKPRKSTKSSINKSWEGEIVLFDIDLIPSPLNYKLILMIAIYTLN